MQSDRLLRELAEEIAVCPRCRLAATRTHAVPGEGNPAARIMLVGEGPGEQEDRSGRPFVGPAGKLLGTLLQQAGLSREEVFITNIVKCRPPGNRDPQSDEIAACHTYLMAQIALIEPRFICPLGKPATRTLLGLEGPMTALRGKVYRKAGILYIPQFHPAAALHNPDLRDVLREDFVRLKDLLSRPLREAEITDLGGSPSPVETAAAEPAPDSAAAPATASESPPATAVTPSLF